MSSSPANSRDTSPSNDSRDDSSVSQPEPMICSCQNQLAHWDWEGVLHKNLPELCRQFIEEDKDDAETSAAESDSDWEHGRTNQFAIYKRLKTL